MVLGSPIFVQVELLDKIVLRATTLDRQVQSNVLEVQLAGQIYGGPLKFVLLAKELQNVILV